MSRGTRAVLRLDALLNNLEIVRRLAPRSQVIAVVKANAYGHGLEPVSQVLSGAAVDGFAVATLDEACRLRACGVSLPILLLQGMTSATELTIVERHSLDIVVHSHNQIAFLEHGTIGTPPIRVWLKIDTGMHRLGFSPENAAGALQRLRAVSGIDPEIILMSHLANADDTEDDKTRRQTERLDRLASELQLPIRSLANSAGIMAWPDTRQQLVRAGLMLYGISPLSDTDSDAFGLQPCMTLESTLIAISHCEVDDAIGYGGAFRCPEAMPVGVVSIGYGDGYPRRAHNGTPVLVNGVRCPLIGRVSMDMLSIDLRPMPGAGLGDRVVLWGEGLPVEEVAKCCQMISYELISGLTQRVDTVYC